MSEDSQSSTEVLRALVESSNDAIFCISLDGRILTWNSGAEGMFGFTAADVLGGFITDVLIPQDRCDEFERFNPLLRSGQPVLFDTRRLRKDGEQVDVSAHLSPIRGASGGVEGISIVYRDITARKRAEDDLARANALLDAIFETAPIGLGVWDRDLRFVRVNRRLAEINGLSPASHIGYRPDQLLPNIKEFESIYANWNRILATGESWNNVEVQGATPAQPGIIRTWNESFYPIKVGETIIGLGAVVEEITERKQAQEQIEFLINELNHRSKNVFALVQAIAHHTARAGQPDTFMERFTRRLESLSASQDNLVNGQASSLDLEGLTHRQLAHLSDLIGHAIFIKGPPVLLNRSAAQGIGLAIHELSTNATKYGALTADEGKIWVEWAVEDTANPHLLMTWREAGVGKVEPPTRTGFGNLVIGRMTEAAVGGEVRCLYGEDGFEWRLRAPMSRVAGS